MTKANLQIFKLLAGLRCVYETIINFFLPIDSVLLETNLWISHIPGRFKLTNLSSANYKPYVWSIQVKLFLKLANLLLSLLFEVSLFFYSGTNNTTIPTRLFNRREEKNGLDSDTSNNNNNVTKFNSSLVYAF